MNFAANGIMGQTWKYTYDGAGRLTLALREDSLPGTPLYGQDRFTYDRNGNILSLTNKLGTDSLTVAAPRTGNRLTAATYDANGNETSCTAEGTLSIVYNRLNLPERIVLSGNDTVRYWYSAAGVKLRENATDYSGSLVIKNGLLDKLLVPTGYVAANGNITSNGQYVYFVKDHLGSVRATVAQNGTVLERYWYGPYGDDVPAPGQTTVQTGTTDNPYRFSGKERTPADYDFGARRYLPFRVPRGTSMDPIAEKYFSISPYAYCAGDPVNLVDKKGMFIGKYYSYNGDYVGFDGLPDNRVYLVNDDTINEYNKLDQRYVSFEINFMVLNENAEEVDGLIIITREEDDSGTKGQFEVVGEGGFFGFTLEPSGEPTVVANKNRPIPTGLYNTEVRAEGDFAGDFAFRIYNDNVSIQRGILGHVGNTKKDSTGCILFGMSRRGSYLLNSKVAMSNFRAFFNNKDNIKLIIR